MEVNIQTILKESNDNTILLFNKNEHFYIYKNINLFDFFLQSHNHELKNNEIKIHNVHYEDLIKFILTELRKNLKEYIHTNNSSYILHKQATLSNWNDYSDILYDKSMQPFSALLLESSRIFISFYNTDHNLISYTSFIDDDIFSNLYSFLTEINSCDVVFENIKLQKPLTNMGINYHFLKDAVCLDDNHNLSENERKVIGMLSQHLGIGHYKIKPYISNLYMKIDQGSLNTLNIDLVLERIKPVTSQGNRLLQNYIRQPLKDFNEINKRLDFVDLFSNFDSSLVKGFCDLMKYTKRILKLKINDIIIIYNTILKSETLISELRNKNELLENEFVIPILNLYNSFCVLKAEIEKIIDVNENKLKDESNDIIAELAKEKSDIKVEIDAEYDRVLNINKKIKLEKTNQNEYQFKIPRNEYNCFKQNHFVEKSVLKGGILFTTKNLEELSENYKRKEKDYLDEEKNILDNLLILINNYASSLEVFNYIISVIDVFIAFSRSKDYGFSRPKFGENLSVKNGFHPLLLECIKNSYTLNKESSFCVITGPNMGGKSTFMKQIAIMCLLSQIGCYVPCEEAVLPIIDGLYMRVGANDNACKGLSTFMVEMNDIARICNNATENSLVIIDELGRGTSAIDGLSLALSVKKFLIEKGCFTLFATHFPELCNDNITNKRVKSCFEGNELILLYEIEDGICDVSFGVEVAERVGFPIQVVEMAKKYLNEIDE